MLMTNLFVCSDDVSAATNPHSSTDFYTWTDSNTNPYTYSWTDFYTWTDTGNSSMVEA